MGGIIGVGCKHMPAGLHCIRHFCIHEVSHVMRHSAITSTLSLHHPNCQTPTQNPPDSTGNTARNNWCALCACFFHPQFDTYRGCQYQNVMALSSCIQTKMFPSGSKGYFTRIFYFNFGKINLCFSVSLFLNYVKSTEYIKETEKNLIPYMQA